MSRPKALLIVSSSYHLVDAIRAIFSALGVVVYTAKDQITAGALLKQEKIDLVIIDEYHNIIDGILLTRYIRNDKNFSSNIGLILLVNNPLSEHKITLYELGVDDLFTKPFSLDQLIARIKNLLNRINSYGHNPQESLLTNHDIFHAGDLTLIPDSHEVKVLDQIVHLTPMEYDLLNCLMQNIGKTVSPSQIIQELWGQSMQDDIETIRVHIRHLRQRLDQTVTNKKYIKTVYGKGYQLVADGFLDD